MSWNNIVAEQSVFAEIRIERKPAVQNLFQKSASTLSYMRSNTVPKSNVNHDAYRIINMPDTISYIPRHSVFENIILFHADFADFRFVPINQVNTGGGVQSNDSMLPVVITNDIQPVNSKAATTRNLTTSMFTSTLADKQVTDDPVFRDLRGNVESMPNYRTLTVNVAGVINSNSGNSVNPYWVNDVYPYGQYSQVYINGVLASNSNYGTNIDTLTVRLIDSLKNIPHDTELTSYATQRVFIEIRQFITNYVNAVHANENALAEEQRNALASQMDIDFNQTTISNEVTPNATTSTLEQDTRRQLADLQQQLQ